MVLKPLGLRGATHVVEANATGSAVLLTIMMGQVHANVYCTSTGVMCYNSSLQV